MARRLLAWLLLAMAGGQLSDVGGFVEILDRYQIGGAAIPGVVAAGLLVGELVGGAGLLSRRESLHRPASLAAVAVAAGWSVLATQAFARGVPVANCGCFGVHLGQPLRWWVLVEDAEFLALALWVRHTTFRSPGSWSRSAPARSSSR